MEKRGSKSLLIFLGSQTQISCLLWLTITNAPQLTDGNGQEQGRQWSVSCPVYLTSISRYQITSERKTVPLSQTAARYREASVCLSVDS